MAIFFITQINEIIGSEAGKYFCVLPWAKMGLATEARKHRKEFAFGKKRLPQITQICTDCFAFEKNSNATEARKHRKEFAFGKKRLPQFAQICKDCFAFEKNSNATEARKHRKEFTFGKIGLPQITKITQKENLYFSVPPVLRWQTKFQKKLKRSR